MVRVIVLILLLWLAVEVASRGLARFLQQGQGSARMGGARKGRSPCGPKRQEGEGQALTKCPVCQVHFPAPGSSGGSPYCSDGCRQAARSGPS